MKLKYQNIKTLISELIVNKNNYRHIPLKNEQDAINKFCLKSEEKMLKLSKSIAEEGILPLENFIIIKKNKIDNKYIVLDGNRRLTVLKILQNPNLIPDESSKLKNYCLQNKQNFSEEKLDCYEYFVEKDASKVIFIKHSGRSEAARQERWSKIRQIQYEKKYLNKEKPKWYKIIEKNIPKFLKKFEELGCENKISTIERILANPEINNYIPMNEKLEFINENSKIVLKKIFKDVSENIINTRTLNTNKEQKEYLNSITNNYNDILIKNLKLDKKIENSENINNILPNKTIINNIQNDLNNSNINKNKNFQKENNSNLKNNKKNIKEEKYKLGNLTKTNKKLEHNNYQGIIKLLTEIKILKNYYKYKQNKQQLYKILPISTLSLIRNLYEQLLKFYLKEYHMNIFEKIKKQNNNEEKNIKLNNMIKTIVNLKNSQIIFNKDIDKNFKIFNEPSLHKTDFLNIVSHQSYLYTGNIDEVEKYTSGFVYELFDFILNKQD
ncbi:ParB/Srx family N-terminal domain-containing protein [Candidatus Phytoplasma solani]|uniref:ParB/Srx family N-terminal domain-containing protein n=1 Tax=Candidatus Phytoplasma solani TaxID=69896 RepID=UPI00358FF414